MTVQILNQDKMQTGRTSRMLDAAIVRAAQTTVYAVFPTQSLADAVKRHRKLDQVATRLYMIGMFAPKVESYDVNAGTITISGEGMFEAFFDHSAMEHEATRYLNAAAKYDALPGQYGHQIGPGK